MDEYLPAATLQLYQSRSLQRHNAAARVLQHAQQIRLGRPAKRQQQTFEVHRDPTLPALAWACTVTGAHHTFVIGPRVNVGGKFIFEGVWDGDFADGQVHRTDYAFGSGARLGKYVVFVPPKHCWEHLYVVTDDASGTTVVSNSAVFALVHTGSGPDDPFTDQVFKHLRPSTDLAVSVGFDRYDPLVVAHAGRSFYRMMFHNFTVSTGAVHLAPTAATESLDTYSQYRQFLSDVIDRLAQNGSDPLRTTPLPPITPLSSGYDSTATAVLASELGYREAVTQDLTIRGTFDSGQATGARLGMNVSLTHHLLGTDPIQTMGITLNRPEQLDLYAEFLATPGTGDNVMLAAMQEHLTDRIMLNGAMGDSIWKRRSTVTPGLPISIAYNRSYVEFRLRVGFAFVPVPALGARFPDPIRRLCRAPEMAPWTLNGGYDKPIPRRIAEEAGLPRGSFATGKAAINPTVRAPAWMVKAAVAEVATRYQNQCPF